MALRSFIAADGCVLKDGRILPSSEWGEAFQGAPWRIYLVMNGSVRAVPPVLTKTTRLDQRREGVQYLGSGVYLVAWRALAAWSGSRPNAPGFAGGYLPAGLRKPGPSGSTDVLPR
jgi:hypothetical protein